MARSRMPWDVPVALHAGEVADLRDVVVRDLDLGAALPGIAAVRLTAGRLGDRTVLAAIEPVRHPAPDPAGSVPRVPLDVALLALGRPVPVLAVGTDLQRRVLAALAEVPPGEVVTYGELAARAGAPGSARAAARVMATNRVPLVLPCHRVVPAGRGTGAYGWGADVKAALLELEGVGVRR